MYSVLIAEDEELIRRGFIEFIPWNELGFEVVYDCENGTQAIEYLKNNTVDFILTDIVMLGMTGLEIARYVYENTLPTIVCLISGHRDFEYARQAMKYNINHYLTKPTDFDDMIAMVKEVRQTLDKRNPEPISSITKHERFFLDLSIGKYADYSEAENTAIVLGFTPDNIFICPIWITINNFEQYIQKKWKHGKELLFTAVLNFLRDSLRNFIIYNITINHDKGLYVVAANSTASIILNNFRAALDSACANMLDILELSVSYQPVYVFDRLRDFMEYLSDKTNTISESSSSEMIVNKAKNYIYTHFADNISLDDVANHVFLNPSYLSRLFKQYTGENFRDYIIRIRINKAIELINQKQYKIYEISELCGYSNPKYFAQQFKQVTGLSPRDYLNQKE